MSLLRLVFYYSLFLHRLNCEFMFNKYGPGQDLVPLIWRSRFRWNDQITWGTPEIFFRRLS